MAGVASIASGIDARPGPRLESQPESYADENGQGNGDMGNSRSFTTMILDSRSITSRDKIQIRISREARIHINSLKILRKINVQ